VINDEGVGIVVSMNSTNSLIGFSSNVDEVSEHSEHNQRLTDMRTGMLIVIGFTVTFWTSVGYLIWG
jgi:hypothetical protein